MYQTENLQNISTNSFLYNYLLDLWFLKFSALPVGFDKQQNTGLDSNRKFF